MSTAYLFNRLTPTIMVRYLKKIVETNHADNNQSISEIMDVMPMTSRHTWKASMGGASSELTILIFSSLTRFPKVAGTALNLCC